MYALTKHLNIYYTTTIEFYITLNYNLTRLGEIRIKIGEIQWEIKKKRLKITMLW